MAKKDIYLNGIIVGSHEVTGDKEKDGAVVRDYFKEKGLYKETTINDAMFGQANNFAEVAINIYEKNLKRSPFKGGGVSPFIVNAMFSVELYLKAIHNAYGNKVRGHHLVSLYKGMPKLGKAHFVGAANDVKPLYQHEPGTDIFTCLETLNKAFEQWRYVYEYDHLEVEAQSIRYVMHVSHEACCRVREVLNKA